MTQIKFDGKKVKDLLGSIDKAHKFTLKKSLARAGDVIRCEILGIKYVYRKSVLEKISTEC